MKNFNSNGTTAYKMRTGSTNADVKYSYVGQSSEDKELKLSKDGLNSQFNFMLGRIKTVLDAAVTDPIQNKALKDLVSQEVWHRYNYILEITGDKSKLLNDGVVDIA